MRRACLILLSCLTFGGLCKASEDGFDSTLISLIEHAKKVRTFRLNGAAGDETASDHAVAGYRIASKGEKLNKDSTRKFAALLSQNKDFKFISGDAPQDFNPQAGFRFSNGNDTVELVVSGSMVRVQSGDVVSTASFGSNIRDEFQALVKNAFPDDPGVVLSPAIVPDTKPASSGATISEALRTFFGEKVLAPLPGATSVEAYRVKLDAPHANVQAMKTMPQAADSPDPKTVKHVTHGTKINDHYAIIKVGKPLEKDAAAKWIAALSDESGYNLDKAAPDFGPEVAFKLINGEEHVCVEIGFLSNRVRLGENFSSGKAARIKPELRAALFKLVKEAFPNEKDIQRLPATWAWGVQVLEPDENEGDGTDPD